MDFKAELLGLRRDVLAMGALVEQRVTRTVEAIIDQDMEAAEAVRAGDDEIDQMEVHLEQACLRVLALAHPVASDLRFILAVMRINSELERIADLTRGIAKRLIRLRSMAPVELPEPLTDLALAARTMLADVLAALASEDPALGRQVRRSDDRVNDLQRAVLVWCREEIPKNLEATESAIELMTMAQRFERIADITTNIAEDVIFLVEGRVVRHEHA